jgi:hypothetical protein
VSAKSNGRCWIRTYDRLIKNQLHENTNDKQDKDLQQDETGAYKPAYKKNPKTAENQAQELPSDLAEIVAVWPQLPEHIYDQVVFLDMLKCEDCSESYKAISLLFITLLTSSNLLVMISSKDMQ